MKELSVEEKAKSYDEAVEYAHYLINERCKEGSYGSFHRLDLERMFPELTESEDERIRKDLLGYLHTLPNHFSHNGSLVTEWIAWLEKQGEIIKEWSETKFNNIQKELQEMVALKQKTEQGEQNPAECSRVPLREIVLNVWELGNDWKELTKGSISTEHGTQLDYIVKHWKEGEHYIKSFNKQGEPTEINPSEFDSQLNRLLKQFESLPKEELASSLSFYLNVVQNDGTYKDEKQGEQKPVDKIEPKFHEGDWVAYDGWHCQITEVREDGYCNSTNGFIPKEREYSMRLIITEPAEWSNNDDSLLEDAIHAAKETYSEHCGQEELVDWLKSLKDRVQPQPRQEWSEEDEKFVHGLIRGLAAKRDIHGHTTFSSDCIDITETINWLKSLRPQNTWKPSDEQMQILHWCMPLWVEPKSKAILESLINDLKKLREE